MLDTKGTSRIRVLVAEDNPALALVVRLHLENAGYQVTAARNGAEAWGLLERNDFEVLVTDHQMPELTGGEICRRMRQDPRLAQVGVVMLTAKGLEMDLDRMRSELGVWQVMPKPFSVRQLVEVVDECSRRQSTWSCPAG
jgi:two-component system, chemotaxis family, chemotaxis protein CheY